MDSLSHSSSESEYKGAKNKYCHHEEHSDEVIPALF